MLQHYSAVLNTLLPALCGVVSAEAEGGDTRFFCLRMVSEMLQALLLDAELYGSAAQRAEGGGGVAAGPIDRVLRSHILPLVPRLLRDEDPMPLYALKVCVEGCSNGGCWEGQLGGRHVLCVLCFGRGAAKEITGVH